MTEPAADAPTNAPASTLPTTRPTDNTPDRSRVPVRMGIAPTGIDEAWRLSQYLANSELVPKQYRGRAADVLVGIQLGMELGLAPVQALQSIAVVNGRATVWGDAMLAIVMASPLYVDHDEYFEVGNARRDGLVSDDWKAETTCAVFTITRHNKRTPIVSRFSVANAKKAGLLGKEGPWQTYPDRMLKMRARGFGLRDGFPDLLRGIHIAEEVYDTPDDESTTDRAPLREVRRVSERHDPHAFVDRTADTRQPDALTQLGPIAVADVEPFMGLFHIRLADGITIETNHAGDAAELEKVKGSGHKFTFTVTRATSSDRAQLVSFAIAD